MTPAPSLQELIDTVRSDAGSNEPLAQLAVASRTAGALEDTMDAVLGFFVDQCRRSGHSWTEISEALGVTKQAAHKRFSLPVASPNLDRFTPRVSAALAGAGGEARSLGHGYVGTEHLLLALFQDPQNLAAKVLSHLGVERGTVEQHLLAIVGRGSYTGRENPPFTPRAADVVTGALSEALTMGHNYVGTEHVLLALFRDQDSLAQRILSELEVTRSAVHRRVLEALAAHQPPQTGEPPA